jgi:hypothetical protein
LDGEECLLERSCERILHTPELAERNRIGSLELEQAVGIGQAIFGSGRDPESELVAFSAVWNAARSGCGGWSLGGCGDSVTRRGLGSSARGLIRFGDEDWLSQVQSPRVLGIEVWLRDHAS